MKKNLVSTTLFAALILILAGCQLGSQRAGLQAVNATQPTSAPTEPAVTLTPRPTRTPLPSPTATQDPAQARSEAAAAAVQEYFSALEAQDFEKAAGKLSEFSLMVFEMTRGDAASELALARAEGTTWSNLETGAITPYDENTILVQVKYDRTGKPTPTATVAPNASAASAATAQAEKTAEPGEPVDELWSVRLENGAWRVNWKAIIDYRTLDVAAQTLNSVTVKPVLARRFPDRIQVVMLVQNRSSQPVVFGQVNEILGTFYFAGQAIEAEKIQKVFNPLRSVPDFTLEVKGDFKDYPDTLEMRRWKNYNVKPWFTFLLK